MGGRARGIATGAVVGLALTALVVAAGAFTGRDVPAIEPWSGWSEETLATALLFGTPDADGVTFAEHALETVRRDCPAHRPEDLDLAVTSGGDLLAVRAIVDRFAEAECAEAPTELVHAGWLDVGAGTVHTAQGPDDAPARAGLWPEAGAALAPGWAAPERPLRTSPGDGPVDAPGVRRLAELAGPDLATAMLLGRFDAVRGFAATALSDALQRTCGSERGEVDAEEVAPGRWLVTVDVGSSERCPDGRYGLALVDLRHGLVNPPGALDALAEDGSGLPPALPTAWRLATWFDDVRSAG